MSDARDTLARLRELHEAATPGTWETRIGVESDHRTAPWARVWCGASEAIDVDTDRPGEDAALIAAMRNALEPLLSIAEVAARLRDVHDERAEVGHPDDVHARRAHAWRQLDDAIAALGRVKP